MNDGAQINIDAESAMKKIVGGEEIPKNLPSDEEFEKRIREVKLDEEFSYASCADATARIILEAYEKYPQLQNLTDKSIMLKNGDGLTGVDWDNPIKLNITLTDVINKLHPKGTKQNKVLNDLTGFMWGWAVNAARKILNLGTLPNPALLTIQV